MLADDVAATLPEVRAHAESLMIDTCLITRAGEPVWDEGSGTYTPGAPVTVYDGKCRVRNANPAPQNADSGETMWAVDLFVLSLPVVASVGVRDGDTVTITASMNDPGMVGMEATVQGQHWQTNSTARRFTCQVVSRDA